MPIAILGVLSDLFLSEKNNVSEDIWMNRNAVRMILLISAIYSTAYALTLAKGIFYDEMMFGFQLNNLRFGQLFSALGICSMLAYLCAAWFSNKYARASRTHSGMPELPGMPVAASVNCTISSFSRPDARMSAARLVCAERYV